MRKHNKLEASLQLSAVLLNFTIHVCDQRIWRRSNQYCGLLSKLIHSNGFFETFHVNLSSSYVGKLNTRYM